MYFRDLFRINIREFFDPLFDYGISEYLAGKEARLEDLGISCICQKSLDLSKVPINDEYLHRLETEYPGVSRFFELGDVFPRGYMDYLKGKILKGGEILKGKKVLEGGKILEGGKALEEKDSKIIIIEYGDIPKRLLNLLGVRYKQLPLSKVLRKAEAGLVPIVHGHPLFKGSPHPYTDKAEYEKVRSRRFIPCFEEAGIDEALSRYCTRFQGVLSNWSDYARDTLIRALDLSKRLDDRKQAEILFAEFSLLCGDIPDIEMAWEEIEFAMKVPKKPDLNMFIIEPSS